MTASGNPINKSHRWLCDKFSSLKPVFGLPSLQQSWRWTFLPKLMRFRHNPLSLFIQHDPAIIEKRWQKLCWVKGFCMLNDWIQAHPVLMLQICGFKSMIMWTNWQNKMSRCKESHNRIKLLLKPMNHQIVYKININ